MATASALGRPLAFRPPNHPEEPSPCGKCIPYSYSNRMTNIITYWNHHANLSHHYRRASTSQVAMETHYVWLDWVEKTTQVWTSPEPPDPDSPDISSWDSWSDRRHGALHHLLWRKTHNMPAEALSSWMTDSPVEESDREGGCSGDSSDMLLVSCRSLCGNKLLQK